jgi:hypothetical protein
VSAALTWQLFIRVFCFFFLSRRAVLRARCPQRAGLEGICVKRTAQALHLVSPQDVLHGTHTHSSPTQAPFVRARTSRVRAPPRTCVRPAVVPTAGARFGFAVGEWACALDGAALPPPPPRPLPGGARRKRVPAKQANAPRQLARG